MYPQTGEGLSLALVALEHVVQAGAAICTVARGNRHRLIHARRGFIPLAAADGTPTLAPGCLAEDGPAG